jgi:hypothetical protein
MTDVLDEHIGHAEVVHPDSLPASDDASIVAKASCSKFHY